LAAGLDESAASSLCTASPLLPTRRLNKLTAKKCYDTVSIAKQGLNRFFDFHNRRRPHSTLDGKALDTAYFNLSKPPLAAAA
jgi:hypothetical protein